MPRDVRRTLLEELAMSVQKSLTVMVLLLALCAAVLSPLAEINRGNRPQGLDSFLFFPAKYPGGNWNPNDLTYVDVFFDSEDRTRLHAWYCPCEAPVAHVLILHWNAGNISTRGALIRLLQKANVDVFIFDYRGYGKSSGTPSIEGALKDANAARAKFCELARVARTDVLLLGESLGGAFAVAMAADSQPKALVLQSTFSSLRGVADVHYPDRSSMIPPDLLNSTETISQYDGRLLMSHGENDSTVPYSLAIKLFSAANEPKQFVSLPNSDHHDAWDDAYASMLLAFIKSSANPNEQGTKR